VSPSNVVKVNINVTVSKHGNRDIVADMELFLMPLSKQGIAYSATLEAIACRE
jgi:hypothetical protein